MNFDRSRGLEDCSRRDMELTNRISGREKRISEVRPLRGVESGLWKGVEEGRPSWVSVSKDSFGV